MNLSIVIDETYIATKTSSNVSFNLPSWLLTNPRKEISGVVTIDGTPVRFTFSYLGNDGCIDSDDANHRYAVKAIVGAYIHTQLSN